MPVTEHGSSLVGEWCTSAPASSRRSIREVPSRFIGTRCRGAPTSVSGTPRLTSAPRMPVTEHGSSLARRMVHLSSASSRRSIREVPSRLDLGHAAGGSYKRVGDFTSDFSPADAGNGTWQLFGSANGAPQSSVFSSEGSQHWGYRRGSLGHAAGQNLTSVSDSTSDFGPADAENGSGKSGRSDRSEQIAPTLPAAGQLLAKRQREPLCSLRSDASQTTEVQRCASEPDH